MLANLQDISGAMRLREAWPKIEANDQALNAELAEHTVELSDHSAELANHTAELADHNAELAEHTAELGSQDSRITNLVVHAGDSGPEALDARVSTPKAKTFTILKARLDAGEKDVLAIRSGYLLEPRGICVFESDDGRDADYTILRPMFEAEGVPCCSAIIADIEGSGYGSEGFMTDTQILDLQNRLGWEIMSHSISHTNPYITEMSDADAEAQYRDSRSMLIARGMNVESYVTPGNLFNTRERIYAKRHYRAARVSEFGADGFNRLPIETHELKTIWLDPDVHSPMKDFNYYKGFIDQAAAEKLLLIISTHSSLISTPELQALFLQVIQYAKAHTSVMTLRDALDLVGNSVDIGDFSKTSTGTRAPSGSHMVIGSDGTIDDGREPEPIQFTIADLNQYTPSTTFDNFPFGETICAVDSTTATATSAPENTAGVLRMYKVSTSGSLGYNYQQYHLFGSGKVYERNVASGTTFGAWKLIVDPTTTSLLQIPVVNTYTPATTYGNIPEGISYSTVDSATATSSSAPENSAGTLVTHKVSPGGAVGYNFQMYHLFGSNKVYKRNVTAGPAFGAWGLIYPYVPPTPTHIVAAHNAYDCTTAPGSFPIGAITEVTTSTTTGTPTATAGTIRMHNTYPTIGGYTFQEFHVWGSVDVYKRYCTSTTTYSAWVKVSV